MKKLTVDQKARFYDEAIEKLGVILNLNTVKESGTISVDDIRKIFPELKESEDEKIRKWLIAQLELKSDANNSRELELMILKSIAWLEKQGGQKPNWSEEDEENFRDIVSAIHNVAYQTSEDEEARINWLRDIKYRYFPQSKQKWSEEDEHRVKDTIYFLDTAKKHYASTAELDACINWLKSLKDRAQIKQKWSGEDESVLEDIKVAVSSYWDEDTENTILDWLESLKPQN